MAAKAEPWQRCAQTCFPLADPLPEWPCHCSYLTAMYWDPPRCFPERALYTHFTDKEAKCREV